MVHNRESLQGSWEVAATAEATAEAATVEARLRSHSTTALDGVAPPYCPRLLPYPPSRLFPFAPTSPRLDSAARSPKARAASVAQQRARGVAEGEERWAAGHANGGRRVEALPPWALTSTRRCTQLAAGAETGTTCWC